MLITDRRRSGGTQRKGWGIELGRGNVVLGMSVRLWLLMSLLF